MILSSNLTVLPVHLRSDNEQSSNMCLSWNWKTTLISNDNHYVDLESSDYKWLDSNGEQGLAKEQSKGKLKQVNPDFPANYIEAIRAVCDSGRTPLVHIGK